MLLLLLPLDSGFVVGLCPPVGVGVDHGIDLLSSLVLVLAQLIPIRLGENLFVVYPDLNWSMGTGCKDTKPVRIIS